MELMELYQCEYHTVDEKQSNMVSIVDVSCHYIVNYSDV